MLAPGASIGADLALRSALGVMKGGYAFQRLREILKERGLEAPTVEPEGTEDGCELSAPFAQSLHIARSVVPDRTRIWGRTLLTAALFDPRLGEEEWLQDQVESVRADWAAFLKADEERNWTRWEEALDEYGERAETSGPGDDLTQVIRFVETQPIQIAAALAGFSGDAVPPKVGPDDDRLHIGPEVEALASVIAARDVKPPLSVALFGDWGAGKSFFMRQMLARIAALAKEARAVEAKRSEGGLEPKTLEPAFWPNIAQIEFNAWHYMDTNLWASLVTHLFKGLVAHIRRDGRIEDPEEEIYGELSLVSDESRRIRAQRTALQATISEVQEQAEGLAEERESKEAKVDAIDLGAAFGREVAKIVGDDQDVRDILVDAGIVKAGSDLKDLAAQVQGLERAAGQGQARLAILLGKRTRKGLVRWTLVLLLGAFGLLAFLHQLDVPPALARSLRPLGQAVAVLTGLLGPIGIWLRRATHAFRSVDSVLSQAESAAEKERVRLGEDENRLRNEIKALKSREARLDAKLLEKQKLDEEARKKLADLLSGQRLLDFVDERARSKEYADHLGIISVIREDFERLSRELGSMSARCRSAWRDGEAQDTEAPCEGGEALRRVNRIVLYIDDLDRCTPERVVDVMQAVHLLLAFPLFVVVVAVDSRWLLRSLAKVYPDFLKLEDIDAPTESRTTTPQSYLEKIFQVTFSLTEIDRTGYATLLRDLLQRPTDQKPPDLEGISVYDPIPPGGAETDDPPEAERRPRQPHVVPAPQEVMPIDLNPPSLSIEDQEWAFMELLDPFFETPRSVKRFVNTYRVLKVTYGSELADQKSQRIVLTLLAALVGFPSDTTRLLGKLESSAESKWNAFVATLPADISETVRDSLSQIDAAWSIEDVRPWGARVARFAPRIVSFSPEAKGNGVKGEVPGARNCPG